MRLSLFRCICWAFVVGVLGFFLVMEIGISHIRTVETDFLEPSRSFSAVGPPTRVDGYDSGCAALRIVGEPVYVDVRLPRLARLATVTVWGSNGTPVRPSVGVEQDGVIVALTPLLTETSEDTYTPSRATLDLSRLKKTDGAIRLALSLPSLATTTPFFLHQLRVTTIRPSLRAVISSLWKD
jgi:hypothetical protein